jgi:hypothetical protein
VWIVCGLYFALAEKSYVAALVGALKQQGGSMLMGALASKVKKPDTLKEKFKAFILKHPEAFDFDANSMKISAK